MQENNLRGLEKDSQQKKRLEAQLEDQRRKAEQMQRESERNQEQVASREKVIEQMQQEIGQKKEKLSKNEQKIQELELKLEFQKAEKKQQGKGFGQEKEAWKRERTAMQSQNSQMREQFQKLEEKLSEQSNQMGKIQRERDNHSKTIERLKIEKQGFIGRLTRENPLLESIRRKHTRTKPKHQSRTRVPASRTDPAMQTQRRPRPVQIWSPGPSGLSPIGTESNSGGGDRPEEGISQCACASVRIGAS